MAKIVSIDVSGAKATIDSLRIVHSEEEMNKILRRSIQRTAYYVKNIVAKESAKHYHITQKRVRDDIGRPRFSQGGLLGVQCSIPIEGHRLAIGGSFPAAGGRHGWRGIKAGKRYKISTKILRTGKSTLPEEMNRQGGQPPFRNYAAKEKLKGVAFTRVGKERLPIAPVVGIAVPQMPLNRARDDVEKNTTDYLIKRLEAEHNAVFKRYVK